MLLCVSFPLNGWIIPDSKVHGANMGPIWGRQELGGPHDGPMDFVIWDDTWIWTVIKACCRLGENSDDNVDVHYAAIDIFCDCIIKNILSLIFMATQIWINIGSDNGLVPEDTKPLHEPMLTSR